MKIRIPVGRSSVMPRRMNPPRVPAEQNTTTSPPAVLHATEETASKTVSHATVKQENLSKPFYTPQAVPDSALLRNGTEGKPSTDVVSGYARTREAC